MRTHLGLKLGIASIAFVQPSFAWWGFGHYRVAMAVKEARPQVNVDYSMVPDAWDSKNSNFWGSLIVGEPPGGISIPFTFSHAAMRYTTDFPPPAPPIYPHDGRYPGPAMYELATQKVNFTFPTDQQAAVDTAIGSVMHNAADNIVHFDYFLGGDGNFLGYNNAVNMWARNHCTKEEWASYVLLMLLDLDQA